MLHLVANSKEPNYLATPRIFLIVSPADAENFVKEDCICMKKPEMEIVKFHNEDVIATSNWSGRVWLAGETYSAGVGEERRDIYTVGGWDVDASVWMNSAGFNLYGANGNATTGNNYNDMNTLDGNSFNIKNFVNSDPLSPTYYHYELNSYIGGWNEGSEGHTSRVYNVWKTCTGDENCTGNCHAN